MLDSILLPSTQARSLWFHADCTDDAVHVQEYQMYAVEKWIVDRSRPINVLLVYTGDPSHRITLSKYTPKTRQDYDDAVHHLRRDGARPKQTPHGVLMVTSLAHFRSDYTIVKIPDGDFLAVKDQLYANINLLRLGCSGRSALALEEPSEPTKERFLSAYQLHLPPNKGKDRPCFTATVLELVKLIQAGLAVFACYGSLAPPTPSIILDGLLCDGTVEGIHRWIADIGEPCLGLEPTERVADPSVVSALLSMVLAIRNKLAALIASCASSSAAQIMPVPKDPFVYPYAFSLSLKSYLQHASTAASNSPVPPAPAFTVTQMAPFVVSGFAPAPPSASVVKLPIGAALTHEIVEHIDSTYEKAKSSDNKRVRRVLKGKLDDLTRTTAVESDGDDSPYSHHHHHHPHKTKTEHRKRSGTLSDTEASHMLLGASAVNSSSIGSSSGNRVLGGISTLLLPGATSLSSAPLSMSSSGGGGPGGGAGSITEPMTSLSAFLSVALSKEAGGGSSFSSGRKGAANLKRIRGSVGGGITTPGASSGGERGKTLSVSGVSKAIAGKSKRQRESVDMGYFYTGGALAGTAGVVPLLNPSFSVGGMAGPIGVEGAPSGPHVDTKDWDAREKEVVVGGSVKALWGGRVLDLVKVREWCEEVAQSHGLENSALVLPSSTYYTGGAPSQRAVSGGSTVGSQHSGTSNIKDKGKKKSKHKESLRISPSNLLSVHSDGDHKSDTGRSTEGEESESIYPSASNTPSIPHETLSSSPMASGSFGSLLGGRVRGKLGSWAGLAKRKGHNASVDLGSPQLHFTTHSVPSSLKTSPVISRTHTHTAGGPADGGSVAAASDTDGVARPSAQHRGASAPMLSTSLKMDQGNEGSASVLATPMRKPSTSSGPQSPTLPPMVYPGDISRHMVHSEEDEFEGEILSSGQISPLSDHKSTSPFIPPRSRPSLARHFSLTLPPTQQDRNYLSVSSVNEKLLRLSTDSARSSNTNLTSAPSTSNNPNRRKLFLHSAATSAGSNVFNATDDDRVAEEGSASRGAVYPALRRPKFGAAGGGTSYAYPSRSYTTTASPTPRVSSWSDPLSARYILGGGAAVSLGSIPPLDLGGSEDLGDEEGEDDGGIMLGARRVAGTATRSSSVNRPFVGGRSGGGGGTGAESEGDTMLSDASKHLVSRPSLRTRRRTEQASVISAARRSRDELGRVERGRFHSMLSVVDPEGGRGQYLEEPLGSWAESPSTDVGAGAQQLVFEMDGDLEGYNSNNPEWMISHGEDVDDDVLVEGGVDLDDEDWVRRRRRRRGARYWCDPMRRRSFQDLDEFGEVVVGAEQAAAVERMRVDVEMCGQVLVMTRREEHLRNVAACLEILNSSLSQANGLLRHEYESHIAALSQLTSRTKVLADLDLQSTRTDNLSQQTNVLRYEAEQFNVPSLYHAASLSRQKVLEMRHKVFGVHKVELLDSNCRWGRLGVGRWQRRSSEGGEKEEGEGENEGDGQWKSVTRGRARRPWEIQPAAKKAGWAGGCCGLARAHGK
ncbi:hypothetical protein DFP72DRAFT_957982 [Ephemerocybe angulata]|uniref:STB6-like N-terminal domain-containing protein n=1 Tax=Ephemerocybe angulata TaxID=980116 RepID=A0A8H6IDA6_9AGAR|nr:hypothetical protein DFP72DRAFT_957982 [Tulosesus angulatus]